MKLAVTIFGHLFELPLATLYGREFLIAVSGPQLPSVLSLRRVGLHAASKYNRP